MKESWFSVIWRKAFGKKRLGAAKSSSNTNRNVVGDGGLGIGLEFVKCKKKRVLISGGEIRDSGNICGNTVAKTVELEALPQDILIRIICGVEHEDLKQLFNVSKTIRAATLIAKKRHFEYRTPKKTLSSRGGLDSIELGGDEIQVPLLKKCRLSRITCRKKLSNISMALFK